MKNKSLLCKVKITNSFVNFLFLPLLLVTFVSCSNMYTTNGYLNLQLSNKNSARSTYAFEQLDFAISITNQETNETISSEIIKTENKANLTVELVPGFYKIEIDAFTTAEDSTKTLVYRGNTSDIQVKAGKTTETSLMLNLVYTINFDANGGTGEMKPVVIKKDQEYTIPECSFTPAEKKHFSHWSTTPENSDIFKAEEKYTVSQNTTFYAIWENDTINEKSPIIINEESSEHITVYFKDNSKSEYNQETEERIDSYLYTFEAKSKYKMESFKWLLDNKEISDSRFSTKKIDDYTTQLIYGESSENIELCNISLIYSYYNENKILTYDTVSFIFMGEN